MFQGEKQAQGRCGKATKGKHTLAPEPLSWADPHSWYLPLVKEGTPDSLDVLKGPSLIFDCKSGCLQGEGFLFDNTVFRKWVFDPLGQTPESGVTQISAVTS